MNARALGLGLALIAVAGCSGGSSDDGGTTTDLTTIAHDMSALPDLAPSPDLAMVGPNIDATTSNPGTDLGQFSCAATVACTRACPAQNSGQCVTACIARASNDAMTYFLPLEQCAGPACSQNSTDAGPAPCSDPGSNVCIQCVEQYCGSELNTCLAH